jgi:hypothetical protein
MERVMTNSTARRWRHQSRSHLATTDSSVPTVSECEGERRPLPPEVVPQDTVCVVPAASSSRLACRCRAGVRGPSHKKRLRGDNAQFRRSPSPRTPRCPQPIAVSPTTPVLLRAPSGSAFGSTHEGGATPPPSEDVARRLVDVCPCGTSLPPRSNPQSENGPARLQDSTEA